MTLLFFILRSANRILTRFGTRFGFHDLSDIASLPLMVVLFGVTGFVLTPMALAVSRHYEHEAGRFGLEITHDNYACATAFVKLQRENIAVPRPGSLFKIFL